MIPVNEAIPLLKIRAGGNQASYIRASRYRNLLRFVADRVLTNPEEAETAVNNTLFLASQLTPAFGSEGAFRSWLVRVAMDQALAIRVMK